MNWLFLINSIRYQLFNLVKSSQLVMNLLTQLHIMNWLTQLFKIYLPLFVNSITCKLANSTTICLAN